MKNFLNLNKLPLITSFIFLLLSGSTFVFLYTDMKKNRSSAEESETTWQTDSKRRSELQSVKRSLKDLEAERVLFDAHFVEGGDVVPFLNMIETLAPKAGAKVLVSLVDLPKDNSGLVVEMRSSGSFEAVYKFLLLLENSPYELDFSTIDFQKADTSDDLGKVSSTWLGIFRVKVLSFVP